MAVSQVAAPKSKPRKSLYAKSTDTGIDPREAARRLNIDWDSAAEIEEDDDSDEIEVPPAVVSSIYKFLSSSMLDTSWKWSSSSSSC